MDFGYSMESHTRGVTSADHHDAYREFFKQVQICEDGGMDYLWVSEHHFNGARSFGSASMVVSGAIAARTERIKIGSAVIVVPNHDPLHVAEEVSNMDHLSNGRFELGIGRSGGVSHYQGFNMDYAESQPRFAECLEILKLALSQERFSYKGDYYEYNDVPMVPRPLTIPYPKIRWAVNSSATFEMAGTLGMPIFCGVLQLGINELSDLLASYDAAKAKAGFDEPRDAALRIPIYVSDTMDDALTAPMEGFSRRYSSASDILQKMVSSGSANYVGERQQRIDSLGNLDWEAIHTSEKAIVGTPDVVVDKIKEIGDALQLSGMVLEFNAGERLPEDKLNRSLELFCEKVAPAFA